MNESYHLIDRENNPSHVHPLSMWNKLWMFMGFTLFVQIGTISQNEGIPNWWVIITFLELFSLFVFTSYPTLLRPSDEFVFTSTFYEKFQVHFRYIQVRCRKFWEKYYFWLHSIMDTSITVLHTYKTYVGEIFTFFI